MFVNNCKLNYFPYSDVFVFILEKCKKLLFFFLIKLNITAYVYLYLAFTNTMSLNVAAKLYYCRLTVKFKDSLYKIVLSVFMG